MIGKLLIANRGEIAVRIIRTCRDLGVSPVTVHSDVDAGALHVRLADESMRLPGGRVADTYLNAPAIIEAARASGAEAVHPGYGFLAESAGFAASVAGAGLIWVGPPPEAIAALGDKIAARRLARNAGIPVVPGLTDPVGSPKEVVSFGAEHGYPLVIKAAAGGGGRGLKVVASAEEVDDAFDAARREARAYFGSDAVYVESYLAGAKHIEIQIVGRPDGEALWFGARDCSLQRRRQKLIEETPPPARARRIEEMGTAALQLASAAGYVNAGTVELLVDHSDDFFFLEVNSRLQVEHTVTEETFGVDLVALQLSVASDEVELSQGDLASRGHAIECRINAEDPHTLLPAPGRIARWEQPSGPGIRVDAGFVAGDTVPGDYDSLLAKVIAWGSDRDQALARMKRALSEFVVEGVPTTIPLQLRLLHDHEFIAGQHTTATLQESSPAQSTEQVAIARLWNPAMAAATPSATSDGVGRLVAPLQGTIVDVRVAPGDRVARGDVLLVLEAMKMETVLSAPFAGTASDVRAVRGQAVGAGELLVVVEQELGGAR